MGEIFNPEAVKILNQSKDFKRPGIKTALLVMSNHYPSLEVICNTEIGLEILRIDLEAMQKLLIKIASGEETDPREKGMFDYLCNVRFPKLVNMLENYLKAREEFEKQ